MTGAPKTDLLTHVHKALRHGLFTVTHTLGATDWADPADAAQAQHAWAELDAQLTAHAHHEDAFIFALLEAHRPGATAALEADHHVLDRLQREVRAAVERAAATGDAQHGLDAYRALTRFTAAYLDHLLAEERDVVPAIAATCTEDDILACRRAFLATVPPEEAAVTQRWLLVSIDRSTRAALLAGARASMPAPAFEGLLALAHAVLTDADRQHLDAALAA